MTKNKVSTMKEIESALDYLALVVDQLGQEYLPLFETVNSYFEERQQNESSIDLVEKRLNKIRKNDTQIDTQNNDQQFYRQ